MNCMAARLKIFDLGKMLMVRGMSIAASARKHDFKDKTVQKVISRYWASERKPRRTFHPSHFCFRHPADGSKRVTDEPSGMPSALREVHRQGMPGRAFHEMIAYCC